MAKRVIPEEKPLDEAETKSLAALRKKFDAEIKELKFHENDLLRMIRGYWYEPEEKLMDLFTEYVKWHKTEGQAAKDFKAGLGTERMEKFKSVWPSGLHGVSRSGHLVLYERPCLVPFATITASFHMDDITKIALCTTDAAITRCNAITDITGKRKYKFIKIMDLAGFSTSHLSKSFYGPLNKFIEISQMAYPETLYRLIVVNAPWIFKTMYTLISPFIDPTTRKKILLGKSYLKDYLDPAMIPKFLNGKCPCAKGRCLVDPFPGQLELEGRSEAQVAEAKAKAEKEAKQADEKKAGQEGKAVEGKAAEGKAAAAAESKAEGKEAAGAGEAATATEEEAAPIKDEPAKADIP